MNLPQEILPFLPILIPVMLVMFGLTFVSKKAKLYNETINFVDQKIKNFKNQTFRSYEEESRAKQQLRKELLLEIENRVPAGLTRKNLQDRVDIL